MTSKNTELAVFAHLPGQTEAVPAGRLTLTEDAGHIVASRFIYGLRYLERSNAIPVDPVSLAFNPFAPARGHELFPAARLPQFGALQDIAPQAWARRVIETRHTLPLNGLNESEYLLQAGNQRVGALEIRASLDAPPPPPAAAPISRLGHLHIAAERIEQSADLPEQLADIFESGSALGGSRPKVAVIDDDGRHWIAKFSSRSDRFDQCAIEAATLRLAAAAGLRVPRLKVVELGGWRRALLVERFDREGTGESACRRHFVSAQTLLACPQADSAPHSYGDIADALRRQGVPREVTRDTAELFARMVFNIFITNDDDQLSNHGVLWDHVARGWVLSPVYDLLPRPTLATERFLQLDVGSNGRAALLDNALSQYPRFGLTLDSARSTIRRVWEVIGRWRDYFDAFGVPQGEIDKVQSGFRHIEDVGGAVLLNPGNRYSPIRRAA